MQLKTPEPRSSDAAKLPPSVTAVATVCDVPTFMERCMGDLDFAQMMLEKYAASLPQSLEEVSRHIQVGDLSSAVRAVHLLKGEAGNFAAAGIHQAALDLEHALRSQQNQNIQGLLVALELGATEFLSRIPDLCDALPHVLQASG